MNEPSIGDEHDTSGGPEAWEEKVFLAAATWGGTFSTYHRVGKIRRDFANLPDALADIMVNGLQFDPETLLYVTTKRGTRVNLPPHKLNHYGQLWLRCRGEILDHVVLDQEMVERKTIVVLCNAFGRCIAYSKMVRQYTPVTDSLLNNVRSTGVMLNCDAAGRVFGYIRPEHYRKLSIVD